MKIRSAKINDGGQITEIYNYYIHQTHHTFETEPITSIEMQNRIEDITKDYPFLVAEEDGEILGYAYSTKYKTRQAYRHSVEVSVYVKNDCKRKKIGKSLYRELLNILSGTDVHAIIAGIALPNEASIKLHEDFGFEKVAHFREVGFKFGKWIDVGYWELINKR